MPSNLNPLLRALSFIVQSVPLTNTNVMNQRPHLYAYKLELSHLTLDRCLFHRCVHLADACSHSIHSPRVMLTNSMGLIEVGGAIHVALFTGAMWLYYFIKTATLSKSVTKGQVSCVCAVKNGLSVWYKLFHLEGIHVRLVHVCAWVCMCVHVRRCVRHWVVNTRRMSVPALFWLGGRPLDIHTETNPHLLVWLG